MDADTPSTIVLIHGLWMTPRSWEHWAARYEERGHRVLAPAWPGLEVEVEELRRDPTPLTRLDVPKVVDHYDRIIRELDAPPIVMGHSIGGTITQLLVDRGLSSAAVGIASATVKGVLDLPLSTMSREESDRIYERYHVPAANRVLFQVGLANLTPGAPTKVDFAKSDRAPLLFAAFGEDHVIPAKATRHNAEKYGKSSAVTEFKEFPGRPHFPGAPAWEDVADYVLDWALRARRS